MNFNFLKRFLFFAAVIFTFAGCEKKSAEPYPQTGNTKITASFYPLYVMLLNICEGTDSAVEMLAPSDTGCLHDYELTTKDMKKIRESDIIVLNGAGMEEFLDKVFETKSNVIVASEGAELLDDNPHIWVSPKGAILEVQNICDGLCHYDPKNAEIYKKNSSEYIEKIQNLSNRMHEQLSFTEGSTIITFHEAFPYFASEFSLEIASVIEREPGTVPSPKELAEVMNLVSELNAKNGTKIPLFVEPQYSSSSAEVISRETGSVIYELDPCVTGKPEKNSYISAMEKNLQGLLSAFSESAGKSAAKSEKTE